MRIPGLAVLVATMVLAAACYDPSLRNCTVTCVAAGDCASGQVCGADGWCAAEAIAGQCAAYLDGGLADAAEPTDGTPPVDAPATDASQSACELLCTQGTCVGGVCTIACGDGACAATVECPRNIPCRVTCSGTGACNGGVRCHGMAACEVECSGPSSCMNEVHCDRGPCDVECSGADACRNEVKCKDTCACDVTCTGVGSCLGGAECPAAACVRGPGCSSQPATCSTC